MIKFTMKYEENDNLLGLKFTFGPVKCLVRIPLDVKKHGVIKPNNTGTHVGLVGELI